MAPSLVLLGLLSLIFGVADTLRVTYVVSYDLMAACYLPGDLSVGLLFFGLTAVLLVLSETLLRVDFTLDLSC